MTTNSAPAFSMAAVIKYHPPAKEQKFKPGPGTYSGDGKLKFVNKDPAWKMGSEVRNDLNFEKRKLF